jgi:hypothetical protein
MQTNYWSWRSREESNLGILYQAAIQRISQNFIQELLSKGIVKNKEGKSIYEMSYAELKSEVALSHFRKIDADNDNNKWF